MQDMGRGEPITRISISGSDKFASLAAEKPTGGACMQLQHAHVCSTRWPNQRFPAPRKHQYMLLVAAVSEIRPYSCE